MAGAISLEDHHLVGFVGELTLSSYETLAPRWEANHDHAYLGLI